MQEERSRDYSIARRIAKEYETITKGLNKNSPSIPPENHTAEETKQVCFFVYYLILQSKEIMHNI